MSEFEERTGTDLDERLEGSFGEFGWLLVMRGDGAAKPLVIMQSENPEWAQDLIEEFTGWWGKQIHVRSLGLCEPLALDESSGEMKITKLAFWTPWQVVPGPLIAASEDYLLVGVDIETLQTGRQLIANGCFRGDRDGLLMLPHGMVSFDDRYIAELARVLIQYHFRDSVFAEPFLELADSLRGGAVQLRYETDALRIRSRIGLIHSESFDGVDPDGAPSGHETGHQGHDAKK
jgi:hypothetical protein